MTTPLSASRAFSASAAGVREARVFAVSTLELWGVEPSGVETVVGELAANAYAHAGTAFTVSLHCADGRISIEVEDRSTKKPVLRVEPPEALRGRGLLIVDALSITWGTRSTADGKVVWAEVVADGR